MTTDPRLSSEPLLSAAEHLLAELEPAGDGLSQVVAARLRNSVVRPLAGLPRIKAGAASSMTDTSSGASGTDAVVAIPLADRIWELARLGTMQRVGSPQPELAEAVAALQDLALGLAPEAGRAPRLSELSAIQAGLPVQIQVMTNGPYLVANARRLVDWLGQDLPLRPQMALCRCGGSAIKPLCDGSHASNGFSDAKDPKRVPDRRDTYVGQQVTVLDNRGICQHSGYCTDRLATVFRLGQEPFVKPSGGRMDEIIRAVRDCPSGALSYAVDGVEARDHVDYHGTRSDSIEVTKDGPYRISGSLPLFDNAGADVQRAEGASREHYALCRCGHSQNKPFCSGMHWYVEFRDPVPEPDRTPTIFEWLGGLPALTRMTRLFYEKHVPEDPLLAPLFADMAADHPERVAKWLAEVFCGPTLYSTGYGGYPRMLGQHKGKALTEEQRARWVTLLLLSAREAGLPNDPESSSAFEAYIEWGSRLAVENSQPGARPPESMAMPHWDWNTAAGPPGGRVSALAPADEKEPSVTMPGTVEAVSFEAHIKPLFSGRDRRSMEFAFDLWSHDDVASHVDAILARLRSGTMPCYGAWPAEWVDVFERWARGGKAP